MNGSIVVAVASLPNPKTTVERQSEIGARRMHDTHGQSLGLSSEHS